MPLHQNKTCQRVSESHIRDLNKLHQSPLVLSGCVQTLESACLVRPPDNQSWQPAAGNRQPTTGNRQPVQGHQQKRDGMISYGFLAGPLTGHPN